MPKRSSNDLGEFIKKVKRERNLSLKRIERDSEDEAGNKISGNYVNDLIQGNAEPTVKKLQALARGIHQSEDLLFEVARGVARNSSGVHRCSSTCLAKQISELPREEQQQLRPLLDMLRQQVQTLRSAKKK